MAQTSIQQQQTIRFGSGVMEVGATVGSLVNIGAFRGGKFTEEFDKVTITSDNAGTVYEGITNHKASLECELMEINLANLSSFYAGAHTMTVVPATPIAITNEVAVLSTTVAHRLAHRNAAGTEVATIVVRSVSGSVTFVRNTDFVVSIDAAGFTNIARIPGSATLTSGMTVHISYSYTPAAHRLYEAGGPQILVAQVARFTNRNVQDQRFEITVWKATSESGISIEFKADNADDVNVAPIKITGTCDTLRTQGRQLFTILDEQHAS